MEENEAIISQILPLFSEPDQIPLILYIQVDCLTQMQYCPGNTLKEYFLTRSTVDLPQNLTFFTQIL